MRVGSVGIGIGGGRGKVHLTINRCTGPEEIGVNKLNCHLTGGTLITRQNQSKWRSQKIQVLLQDDAVKIQKTACWLRYYWLLRNKCSEAQSPYDQQQSHLAQTTIKQSLPRLDGAALRWWGQNTKNRLSIEVLVVEKMMFRGIITARCAGISPWCKLPKNQVSKW